MRKRKSASVVSQFLRQQYGIKWRDISSKLRASLLTELEYVNCNLCGRDDAQTVAQRDKYRLELTSVMCRHCGLIYLNPRPTAAIYRKFYEEGGAPDSVYHRQVDFATLGDLLKFYYGPDFEMDDDARRAMHDFMAARRVGMDGLDLDSDPSGSGSDDPDQNDDGDDIDEDEPGEDEPGEDNAETTSVGKFDYYSLHIYDKLKSSVPREGKVFEPGASAGKMLAPWAALHGCEATGVEPKREAVKLAKDRYGLDLIQGFADDPRIPENAYDLVLNTRTINHMLDPIGDLRNAWRWLKPNGLLFVDIQDTICEARYEGFERNVVEIDHPFMFSRKTLTAMVQKAGFAIVESSVQDLQQARVWDDRDPQPKQIRIVGRKSADAVEVDWPDAFAEMAELLRNQLEFDRAREKRDIRRLELAQRRRTRAEERASRYRARLEEFKARKKSESSANDDRKQRRTKRSS